MSWPTEEMKRQAFLRSKMLPAEELPGRRGYYPVCSKEEWDMLPDLYKAVTWFPSSRVYNEKSKTIETSRPMNAVFNTVYEYFYGCQCSMAVPIENAVQIHMCLLPSESIFAGSSLTGIQFENGTIYAAEKKEDYKTRAMVIYCSGQHLAMQGSFMGHVPDGVSYREEKGGWLYDAEKSSKAVTFSEEYTIQRKEKLVPHTDHYISHTKEEFQEMNPLYRLVTWPIIRMENGKGDIAKELVFEGVDETLGISCTIKTHRENAMKLFSCKMPGSIFCGAQFKGVETEGNRFIPAKLERDENNGCFSIVSEKGTVAIQGGYHNHLPEDTFYEPSGELNTQYIYHNLHKSSIITNQGLNPFDNGWGLKQDIKKMPERPKAR